MRHDHHPDGHTGRDHAGHDRGPETGAEPPPAEPGYPEHPELGESAHAAASPEPHGGHDHTTHGGGHAGGHDMPDQKSGKIQELQARGKRVAMVGEGVNDAPALLTADVGIAIGAGADVAVEAGDLVLVRSDRRDVPRIIALSRAAYRKMVQNLWWATGYNIVAANAQLLRRADLG